MPTDLVEHYKQVCKDAGQQESPEFLQLLQTAAVQIPAESNYPVTNFRDELAFFDRKLELAKKSDSSTDKENAERCEQIINYLNNLWTACQDPFNKYEDVLRQIDVLRSVTGYSRIEQLIFTGVGPELARYLPAQLNKELCSTPMSRVKSIQIQTIDFIFNDDQFTQITAKSPILQDLAQRTKIFSQVSESIASIKKCLPQTSLQQLQFKSDAFTCSRSLFDEFVKSVSDQMTIDEQKTAKFIQQMLFDLNKSNANNVIPTLISLKGAVKRPRIKKYLQGVEQKVQEVAEDVFQEIDEKLLAVNQFCVNIKNQSADNIIGQILKLRQWKITTQNAYQLLQLFLAEENLNQVKNQIKLIVDKLKNKEQDVIKAAKQQILFYYNSFNISKLMDFDSEGKLQVYQPNELAQLIRLTTGLQSLGYDYKVQALTNEIISTVETMIGIETAIGILQYSCSFYNSLSELVKSYQKPLLIKSAAAYESELRKCCQATQMQIGSTNIKDSNYIAKIQKIADYLDNLTNQFKLRIDKLDEFHNQQAKNLEQLEKVSLSQTQIWIDVIGNMREACNVFLKQIPVEMHDPLLLYWSGKLCKLMSSKYCQVMQKDLALLRPLKQPIVVCQDMTLEPSIYDIQTYLIDQVNNIAKVPLNPQFQLTEKKHIQEMFVEMVSLSAQYLPEAFHNISQVRDNLYKLNEYFEKNCGVVGLALQKDPQAAAQKVKSYEQCKMLFDYYQNSRDETNIEQKIVAELPFLQEKSDEKNVYIVTPSGGSVQIDLQTAVRLFSQKRLAIIEVAAMSAGYLGLQVGKELETALVDFQQTMKQNLSKAQTSEEFKKLAENLSKIQKQLQEQLQGKYIELQQFMALIKNCDGQEEIYIKLEKSSASYQQMVDELENINKTLDEKKKEMYKQFQQQLIGEKGLIAQGSSVMAKMQAKSEQLNQYFEKMIKVRILPAPEDQNVFFKQLFEGQLELKDALDSMDADFNLINEIKTQASQIEKEVEVLFNKNYLELMNQSQRKVFLELLNKTQYFQAVFSSAKVLVPLEPLMSKYLKFDWPVLKTNIQIIDEMHEVLQKADQVNTEIGEMNDEEAQQLKIYYQNMRKFQQFVLKSINQTSVAIKSLKSPALQKQHWTELSEKLHLIATLKYFSNTSAAVSQLPDLLNGVTIMHTVSSAAFQNQAAIMSDQPSSESKKLTQTIREIITRAENELAVRSAIEEIGFWLKSDAKIGLSVHELSPLSVQELQNIKSMPLTAQWRPLLTALTEKKAVLVSVVNNPYAKVLKNEIDDAGCQIEALTRFAHIMTIISRQITVLEPVMGRKVLPDQHNKFYQAMKLVSFVINKNVPEDQQSVLQKAEGTVTISVTSTIRQQFPDSLKTQAGSKLQQNVDNSGLGNYKNVVLAFETASSLLQDVQLALRQYLEVKRLAFSRFYFLADQDVLEILANANSKPVMTLAPHIKKLFSAVEKLDIEETSSLCFTIKRFHSSEGEIVQLKCPVNIQPDIAPELWLNRLDLAIKETLKVECMEALMLKEVQFHDVNKMQLNEQFDTNTSYSQIKKSISPFDLHSSFYSQKDLDNGMKRPLDVERVSGEILCLAYAIQFAAQVDQVISNDGDLKPLLDVELNNLQTFTTKLFSPEISTATFGTQQYVTQLKLKCLATDVTHYIAVITQLINEPTNKKWLWNKEMKCRVHNSSDIYFVALDTFLPYTFEYQGLPQKLIHTPLTDRCYSTLISALSCGKSSNPQGPAGTGKTETVKAFAAKLARPCIVFNCDSAIDRENLSRILVGIVLSGSMGCFDEVNRLSPAVLSAVSTDIENIQRAILRRSLGQLDGELSLSDITVPISKVSPFAAVFVTMNPASREYRGRSELPYSLLKLLRGCFMGKADVSLIMETVLSTSGFKNAKQWAEKSELCYMLASRRIPKEVHLDWGLRSLQSVLRQAALARASICRKTQYKDQTALVQMERNVIIKALSDATFSRVQNRSADIFTEILKDVFGSQLSQQQQKFGAASDVEVKLVEHIKTENEKLGNLVLQFYRALTAKLGVSLLGKAASGKSTIRQLLKEAVTKASNGRVEIREFIIAPKSMNRQDLLGYVDPVTKEWNDGALTKAARTSVQLLTQQNPAIWPIIVFDGDVDPSWIEALNSSLDDNRLLSLSSGERIRFPMSVDPLEAIYSGSTTIPTPVSFLFETDSLQHASPATVSRLAVILVADRTEEEQKDVVKIANPEVAKLIPLLPNDCKNKIAEITTHLIMAGQGDKEPVVGMLRALACEIPLDEQKVQEIGRAMSGKEINLSGTGVLPSMVESSNQPQQQVWAIKLIQQYLNGNNSILVSGPIQSSKFYCIQQASNYKDYYQLVSLSCTQLTTRDDIIRIIYNQCVEYQRVDGVKEIKPKSGKKLLIAIRSIDVGKEDEYGHSEIYTLLWSLIAHRKLYLKQGQSVELKNILFAATVENENNVPDRLRRLMGIVRINEMNKKDISQILGNFYTMYVPYTQQKSFDRWLQTSVTQHETLKLRAKSIDAKNVIALPQLLPVLRKINFNNLIRFSQQNLSQDQLTLVFLYYFECQIPFTQGKQAVQNDLKDITKLDLGDNFITYQKAGTTQLVIKSLQQDEPITHTQMKSEVVSSKVRMNMIKEILTAAQEIYPGLRLFNKVLQQSNSTFRNEYFKQISAIENNLVSQMGLIIISQPNNFSAESLLLAAMTTHHDVKFAGCDQFSAQTIKYLGERVAAGFSRIAFVIDTPTLETDIQWIALASAIAADDVDYIRSKLSLADLRGLVSKYSEKHETNDLSEEEVIQKFLKQFVTSIKPVLFLNPESQITDSILSIAPPLRRSFGIISFSVNQVTEIPAALSPTLQSLWSEYQDTVENKFLIELTKYQKFLPPDQPVSSNMYTRMFILYQMFKQQWSQNIIQRQEKLKSGLNQLNAAQKEVDALSKQAMERQKNVEKAQDEANKALEQITKKMETVQANKLKATSLEKELKLKEGDIFQQKEKAEKELDQVKPLLEEAKSAVSSIPNDAMSEVRSFNSPPPAVATVLEAVVLFMGFKDTSWKGIRAFLGQSGVTRQIAAMDINSVSPQIVKRVEAHVQENESAFDQQNIQRISKAAAPLAKWVMANISFLKIFANIEPLMKKCEDANKNLVELRTSLQNIVGEVQQLEKDAEILRNNFNQKTQDLCKYKAELEVIDVKKRKGQTMLDQLSGEKIRWTQNDADATELLLQCEDASIQAAALFVLSGNRTDDVRADFIGEIRKTIEQLMISPSFQDQSQKHGLRLSLQSLENASIMEYVFNSRGINTIILTNITDATGVIPFLKSKMQPQFISATSENLTNLVSIAARFGQTVVITDCDQGTIPSALIPYIRYGYESYKVSESATTNIEDQKVDIGLITPDTVLQIPVQSSKLSEVNKDFKMIIVSSVSLFVPSHVQPRLLELSFAPTKKSRTDLYMDKVLQNWSPETLEKIQQLRATQADLRTQLSEIEDLLLNALKQSKQSKNILDDDNLIQVLNKAYTQNQQIQQATIQAQKAEEELKSLKQKATSIAEVVGRCVQALESIANLNELYIIDDSAVMPLLENILQQYKSMQSSSEKITDEMVKRTILKFLQTMFNRLSNMVFTDDKVGALTILLKFTKPELFNEKAFMYLTNQSMKTKYDVSTLFGEFKPKIEQVMEALGSEVVQKLQIDNTSIWGGFVQRMLAAKEFTINILPEPARSLNSLQKAILISAIRPDLLSQLLSQACDDVFGSDISVSPIKQALELSGGINQPIIIYTAAGQDPTSNLEAEIVALAPGKENEADTKLDQHIANDDCKIIVVKGAHLCQQWLSVLPSRLADYQMKYPQKKLNVVILLEPKLGFPKGLSRIAWRICLQLSVSPRQTMITVLREIPSLEGNKSPLRSFYLAVMYIICALHTTLESRRIYAPRGVANDPGWNSQDPITLSEIFQKILNFDISDQNVFIMRVKGYCADAVYGVQTKDICDLQLVRQLVELAFHKDLVKIIQQAIEKPVKASNDLQSNYSNMLQCSEFINLCDTYQVLKYFIPPLDCLQKSPDEIVNCFIKYVTQNYNDKPSADQLCLPPNALLTKGEKDSLIVRSILMRAGSNVSSQESSQDLYGSILRLHQLYIKDVLPALDPLLSQQVTKPTNKSLPIVEELVSQLQTIKSLRNLILKDLEEAQFASENFLLASQRTKQAAKLIGSNITPEPWAAGFLAPPTSLAPLANPELTTLSLGGPAEYLQLLVKAAKALHEGINNCNSNGPITLDLSMYPRPAAVMEAVRRYEGACQGAELDTVRLVAKIGTVQQSKYPAVQLANKSLMLKGAGFGVSLDFNLPQALLPIVTIVSGQNTTVEVPFYVERQREVRMPVVEGVQFESGSATAISLFGVYIHLSGR
ncbi:Dynein_heavy chain [Hexamita inflata]|uniref:Dynein_heavy chain n=1 Tax=Hexamita inflata TaxID=28002 RepID=A0ABP1HNZ6_9EUKA